MPLHIGDAGSTYYAKPDTITDDPEWGDDAIELTPNAADGRVHTFAGSASVIYLIYLQAGAEPAASDLLVAIVPGEAVVAVSIPAIEAESIELDVEVTKYRGTKWTISVSSLAAPPAKCYCTIKRGSEPDAKAVAQIVVTDPAAGTDGLKILNGATAANLGDGSIVISSYAGASGTLYRATLTLEARATAAIRSDTYRLDFKDTESDIELGESILRVVSPVTDATS